MESKTVLISGANRGIGYALSRLFSEKGWDVIMAGRSKEQLEIARNTLNPTKTSTLIVDVSSQASVNMALAQYTQYGRRLDVIINNAGVLSESDSLINTDLETIENVISTNSWGALRMTKAFYPLLEQAKDPRVINVSSEMGSLNEMGAGHAAYRLSKVLLNGITAVFDADADFRAKIFAVCPGWVHTDMGGPNAPRSPEMAAEGIYWLAESNDAKSGYFYRDKKIIDW